MSEVDYGTVVNVEGRVVGDVLAQAASLGATSLVLDDASLFPPMGFLRLNGTVYQFLEVDYDTNTITLAAIEPLAAAAEQGDSVDVYSVALAASPVVYVAHVRLELDSENDDAVEAIIPHTLIAYLPEGIRTGYHEPVSMQYVAGVLTVSDVLRKEPNLDGGTIDPDTVPGSDGTPPAVSPAPTVDGGIEVLFVSWDAVENNDTVTYDVYLSASTPVFENPADLAASIDGTAVSLVKLPNGSLLVPGTTYFVAIVARDVDGSAPLSVEASGSVTAAARADILDQHTTDIGNLQTDLSAANLELDTAQADITQLNVDLAAANAEIDDILPVQETDISDGAVTTNKILAGSIITSHMVANTINGDRILANSLTAAKIVAGSITTDRMTANTINGDRILANSLDAAKIVAGSITADRISANAIDGMTITGATIQTEAAANSGIKIDSTALEAWDAGGTLTFQLDASTGDVLATGMFRTAVGGERVEVNPSTAGQAEIRFYATNDGRYAYVQGFDKTLTNAGVRMASGRTGSDDEFGEQGIVELDFDRAYFGVQNQAGNEPAFVTATLLGDITVSAASALDLLAGGNILIDAIGTMAMHANSNVELASDSGQLTLSASTGLDLLAGGDIFIDALATVAIHGNSNVELVSDGGTLLTKASGNHLIQSGFGDMQLWADNGKIELFADGGHVWLIPGPGFNVIASGANVEADNYYGVSQSGAWINAHNVNGFCGFWKTGTSTGDTYAIDETRNLLLGPL